MGAVQFFIKSLSGEHSLPSKKDMLQDTVNEQFEKANRGLMEKHFHQMGTEQWKYHRELCQMANLKPLSKAVEKLYNEVLERRKHNLMSYKMDVYQLENEYQL